MPEKKNNAEEPQTLTVEQQNNLMLKEILHHVRWTRRVHTTSLIITITFIVLPILASVLLVPKIVRTFTGIYSGYNTDTGGSSSTGGIMDLFNQIQNAQNQSNQNTNSQPQ